MKSDNNVKVKTAIGQLLRKERPQIREVASVVGLMVSCFPGFKYAPLFYRALENDKTDALTQTGWNHDEHMQISDLAKKDLSWGLENVDHDPCPIIPTEPSVTLKCDSSLGGWGSVIDNSPTTANARWSPQERTYHINYLEIKVVLFGLKSLCSKLKHCGIILKCCLTTRPLLHTSEIWVVPTPGTVIRLREKPFCGVKTETYP